ncbi:hypothetical protein [Pararhizobium haloflavum]|uniref:hypothetical protein n=1 Tax=Pararhizobium haloflavum TaxID=2037914 RepID=UPI000C1769EE|nr:hypothetical protein [Pararhizobium haloflavum]
MLARAIGGVLVPSTEYGRALGREASFDHAAGNPAIGTDITIVRMTPSPTLMETKSPPEGPAGLIIQQGSG